MKITFRIFDDPASTTKLMAAINRLMGLRSFDDPKGQPRIVLSLSYLAFLWMLMIAFSIYASYDQLPANKVDTYVRLLYVHIYIISGLCSTLLGSYHSKTFLAYKKKMLKVDQNLRKLGVTAEHDGLSVSMTIIIITGSLLVIIRGFSRIDNIISHLGLPIGLCIIVCTCYISNISPVILLDFITCVGSVKARYQKVNDLLEVFASNGFQAQENNNSSRALLPVIPLRINNWRLLQINLTREEHLLSVEQQWEYIEKKTWRLQMIKRVHLDLYQASNLLFKIFGGQLALATSLGIINTTAILYHIYMYITQFNGVVYLPMLSTAFGILEYGKLYLLCRTCEYACREVNRTLTIVHTFHSTAIDSETKDELRRFILQLSHCQRGFMERYLSGLNYSFLSKAIGTITMYLVILIQMDESFGTKYSHAMSNNSITNVNSDP